MVVSTTLNNDRMCKFAAIVWVTTTKEIREIKWYQYLNPYNFKKVVKILNKQSNAFKYLEIHATDYSVSDYIFNAETIILMDKVDIKDVIEHAEFIFINHE